MLASELHLVQSSRLFFWGIRDRLSAAPSQRQCQSTCKPRLANRNHRSIAAQCSLHTKSKDHPTEPPKPLPIESKPKSQHKANRGDLAKAHGGEHPMTVAEKKGRRKCLAVFVSGGGSNFKAIHKSIQDGKTNGDVVVVVGSRPDCGGVQYANDHDIDVVIYPKGKFAPEGLDAHTLLDKLRSKRVDYIILAGYLKLLPIELIQEYPKAVLNIHPALLPAFGGKGFYGHKVHEAVVKSGARYSGPTVHFVNEKFDEGPILAQRTVPVLPHDTPDDVASRVLQQEHKLYPEVVQALCDGRVTWRADGVPIIQPAEHGHDWQ